MAKRYNLIQRMIADAGQTLNFQQKSLVAPLEARRISLLFRDTKCREIRLPTEIR